MPTYVLNVNGEEHDVEWSRVRSEHPIADGAVVGAIVVQPFCGSPTSGECLDAASQGASMGLVLGYLTWVLVDVALYGEVEEPGPPRSGRLVPTLRPVLSASASPGARRPTLTGMTLGISLSL